MMLNETRYGHAADGAHERMTRAWTWLCEQRTQAPDHADVWDIRWQNLNSGEGWLTDLTTRILRGEYRLSPLQLHGRNEHRKAVWSAQDALVLKWVALSLQDLLPLHECCEHIQGHGGGKPSTDKLHGLLTDNAEVHEKKTDATTTPDAAETRHYKWVCRTDIRGYYRNINKQTLMQQVSRHVQDPVLRDLVQQYVHYTVEDGGTFHTPEKGISRGCPLSPLMGALHLYDMDAHFSQQKHIHYARYMDDVIILAKTRWQLRKHTKRLMQWFSEYGFEAHPDKTHIGRTEKGFDWMGAWLTHEGVTDIAPRAKANHREKVRRLYEQLARLPAWKRKSAAPKVHARVSAYRRRWNIWAASVLCVGVLSPPDAKSDRDIYVTAGSLPPGTALPGGDFVINETRTLTYKESGYTNAPLVMFATGSDANGLVPLLTTRGGLSFGVAIPSLPGRFGIRVDARDVYLNPISGRMSMEEASNPRNSAGMVIDNTQQTLCNSPYALGDFFFDPNKADPLNTTRMCSLEIGDYKDGVPVTVRVEDLRLQLVTGNNPTPGATSIVTYGAMLMSNLYMVYPKPTSIIVVGLTCTLTASSQNAGQYALGAVPGGRPPGTLVSGLSAAQLGLTASCTGSNSSGQTVPIGYTIGPSAGGNMRAGGKGLEVSGQPSFYMNFTNNGIPSCDESQATSIPADGVTSSRIADVAPGAALQTTPVNLGAALCSTGNTTQQPGPYSMSITASIVSY